MVMEAHERMNSDLPREGGQVLTPATESCDVALMWCTVKEFRRIGRFPVTEKTIIRWLKDGILKCDFRRNKGKRGNLVYEILLIDKNDQDKLQHIRESKSRKQENSAGKKGRRQIKLNMKYEVIEALLSNQEVKSQLIRFIGLTNLAIPSTRKRRITTWVPNTVYDKLASVAHDSRKTISEVFIAYIEQFMRTPSEWELVRLAMRPPTPQGK